MQFLTTLSFPKVIHHNTHTPHYVTNIALNVVAIGTELAPNNYASSTKLLIEATTEKPG